MLVRVQKKVTTQQKERAKESTQLEEDRNKLQKLKSYLLEKEVEESEVREQLNNKRKDERAKSQVMQMRVTSLKEFLKV